MFSGHTIERVVDTHAHIFDPARFPFHPSRSYDVAGANIGNAADYRAVLDSHGISHAVLVNSVGAYGYDNAYLLAAVAESRGRFKGVAVLDHGTPEAEFRRLAEGGVVGVRFNVHHKSLASLSDPEAERTLAMARDLGWFVQIQSVGDLIVDVIPVLERSGLPIVIDHFGRPDFAAGIDQAGFKAIRKLAGNGRTWIKLSSVFRMTRTPWPHPDAQPFLEALVESYSVDRCIWGSDWPFTLIDRRVDYGPMLHFLTHWVPGFYDQRKILWETPAALYGFA